MSLGQMKSVGWLQVLWIARPNYQSAAHFASVCCPKLVFVALRVELEHRRIAADEQNEAIVSRKTRVGAPGPRTLLELIFAPRTRVRSLRTSTSPRRFPRRADRDFCFLALTGGGAT